MRIWRERGLALTLAESHIFVVAWEWVDRRGQRKWLFDYTTPVATPLDTLQDFFVEAAHETTYAFSGNKHFFTKSGHRQTDQNYQLPPQRSQNSDFLSHFSSSVAFFWRTYCELLSALTTWLSERRLHEFCVSSWIFKLPVPGIEPLTLGLQGCSFLPLHHGDLLKKYYMHMWLQKSWRVSKHH